MFKYKKSFLILVFFNLLVLFSCTTTPSVNVDGSINNANDSEFSASGTSLTVVDTEISKISDKQSNINAYLNQIEGVFLTAISSPSEIMQGKDFDSAFVFQATNTDGEVITDLSVTIVYPSSSNSSGISYTKKEMLTDENGKISFLPSQANFSCNDFVYCYITPIKNYTLISDYLIDTAVKLPYKVHTNKLWNVYSISFLDYSVNGNPIEDNSITSSSVLTEMYTQGFYSVSNSEWIDEINTNDNVVLYKHAKTLFNNYINYLIYGKITYEKPITINQKGLKTTTLNVEFSVMSMKTGENLISKTFTVTAEASSDWELLDTLRREKIAPLVVQSIYYGL